MERTVKLVVTVEDLNRILGALGEQPFLQVYQLIGKIQEQAAEQLSEDDGEVVQLPDDDD